MAEALKYDQGKPLMDELDPVFLLEIGAVLTFGAEKYGKGNWRTTGLAASRLYAAALRHLLAWWGGEDADPESGRPHLAHAAACLFFLAAGRGEDDRWARLREALNVFYE